MAKDAKSEAEGAAVAAPKKGKKLLVIIVAALVLVLALGGGGFMVWKKMSPGDDEEDVEVAAVKPKVDKKKGAKETGPIYVALDQFTVAAEAFVGSQTHIGHAVAARGGADFDVSTEGAQQVHLVQGLHNRSPMLPPGEVPAARGSARDHGDAKGA